MFPIFCKQIFKNNKFLQVEPLAPFGRVDFGEMNALLSLEIKTAPIWRLFYGY